MSNDSRAKRDEMSETRNPPSGARGRQSNHDLDLMQQIDRIRDLVLGLQRTTDDLVRRVDDHDDRLHEGDKEMTNLSAGILESNRLSGETLRAINNLTQRLMTEQTVRRSVAIGQDIETRTPSSRMPGISIGNVKTWAPPWLFGALMSLALVLVAAVAAVIGVAYFGHK